MSADRTQRLLVSNDKPQRLPTLCVWSSARHDRKERSFFGEIGEDKEAPLRAQGSGGACQMCRENVSGAQRLCCVMIDEDTVLWKGWGNDTRAVKQLAKQNRLTEKEEAAARKEMEKSEKGKSRAMAGTVDDDTLRSTRSAGIGQQKPSGGRRTVRQVGDAGEDKDPGDMGRGL